MAVTTQKEFAAASAGQTAFTPVGIELNTQDDLDVYITKASAGITANNNLRVLQYRQTTTSNLDTNHPQVNDTTGLYFPALTHTGGTETLINYTISTDNNTITFNSGLAAGDIVYIERRGEDGSGDYTSFSSGSTIRAADLNTAFDEVRFQAQEARNKAFDVEGQLNHTDLSIGVGSGITFEGGTNDAFETTLGVADPTADRTITLPNVTGTVITTGDTATVTAAMLAANSVDSSELVDGSVDLSHMSANSVDSDQYVDGSIDLVHMSANSVDSDQYVDGSIDLVHMSANSVDSDQYVDGSIDSAHIANDQIDSQHYAAGSIDLEHMSANSIDSDQYVDGSIDLAHMSANSVDSDQYVDGSIDEAHIADSQVSYAKMQHIGTANRVLGSTSGGQVSEVQVTNAMIASDAINNGKIADDSIDSEHYVDGSIDLAHMSANSVDSDQYVDGSIDHVHLANDCIDGDNIQDDVINSEHIAAGAVDLEHMSANSVDSDQYVDGSIDLAHMSANSIDSDQYVDGSIDTAHIANDAVDGTKLADNIDIAGTLDVTSTATFDSNVVIAGNLDINGTTTTIDTTNSTIKDALIELGNGTSGTPANDAGLVIERGSSDNAFIGWDESEDKFKVGTGSFTGASTGNLTITTGTVVSNVEGNVTGNVTGNADTATALATGRTIASTGDVTWTSASFDGSGNVTGTAAIGSGVVVNADVNSSAGIEFTKLEDLDSAKILVGNGSNKATEVAVSGDVTIANTGAVTIANDAVTIAKMAGIARGKIIYGDASGNPAVLALGTSGQVLKSDGTDIEWGDDVASGGAGSFTVADESSDTSCFPVFVTAATGTLAPKSDSQLTYNSSSGALGATTFVGNVDAVDGDFDGTLEADAITVDGVALNEYIADTVGDMVSSNTESGITVAYQDADNTLDFTIGTLNQDTTGNAATATVLESARNIGGVSFNGSGNIDLPGVNSAGNQNTSGTAAGLSGTPNITVGDVVAASLDISGDADIDGTLEADAITVDGTALNEFIADTVGAMVGSNTESGITVAYQDADNTLDFTVGTLNQNTTGSAATLTTGRTIGMTGDVVWTSASFNGSGNVTGAATIQSGAVEHAMLAGDAVDGDNIADDSINSEHYVDASIDHAHLAADCVDGDNIADDSINSEHYVNASIDAAHIANNTITATQIAAGAVGTSELAADSVTGAEIGDDQINSEHIAAGAVDLEHMSSESVDEDNLHISNAGSNGQYLQKQSGNSGGLTWATVSSGSDLTPKFAVRSASENTTISSGTFTAVGFDTADEDSDSAYSLTDHEFTVPSGEGGDYWFSFHAAVDSVDSNDQVQGALYKDTGSGYAVVSATHIYNKSPTNGTELSVAYSGVLALAAADKVQFRVRHNQGSDQGIKAIGGEFIASFSGFKLA